MPRRPALGERRKFFLLIYHLQPETVLLDTGYMAGQDIRLLYADDMKTALNLMKKREIATVLTVHQPPYQYEDSFFRYIMQQHPMIQRILLSTVVDRELMEKAINKTHINYFLQLPVPKEEICAIIKKSFKRFDTISTPYKRINALQEYVRKFRQQAETDTLTQLLNRRAFMSILGQALKLFQNKHTPFSLIMLDLDNFKQLNDHYGHMAGDKVLRTLGELIRRHTRSEDSAFRYGGEEFAIITQMDSADKIKIFVERILHEIREIVIVYEKQQLRFTFSGGIAPMEKKITRRELIQRADAALYAAKRQGRNRILVFEPHMLKEFKIQTK
jgi:diguanylate cyclase (GGDEF)-like protein